MKRWAVVFQNFGGPRVLRKTYTRWGAERIVQRLRAEAPVGAKAPSQCLHIESRPDRRSPVTPWSAEHKRRHERQDVSSGHGKMLATRF